MPFSPADPDDADDLIATEVLPVNLHSRQLWHRRSVQTEPCLGEEVLAGTANLDRAGGTA